MNPSNSDGSGSLRREILEEARHQQEDLLRRAQQATEEILAKAETEVGQFRAERLEAARAEAKRRTDAMLATVAIDAGRIRLARVEELLEAIRRRAAEQLRARAGFDDRETLICLAVEALGQMAGDDFRLRLCAADHGVLGDGLAEEIRRRAGRSDLVLEVVSDASLQDGEVLVEDAVGRQIWDLSPGARLERCWPELRRQIAVHAALLEQGAT